MPTVYLYLQQPIHFTYIVHLILVSLFFCFLCSQFLFCSVLYLNVSLKGFKVMEERKLHIFIYVCIHMHLCMYIHI